MRRKDREIIDFNEIVESMKRCETCVLALNDDGFPYIVPLNFGLNVADGTVELYFHSAKEGTKMDLIRKDNRATFEMDCNHNFMEEECSYYERNGFRYWKHRESNKKVLYPMRYKHGSSRTV